MSAPPPALLSAIRSGDVVRELFFRLDHPAGIVRAWSGVGEFVLAGETYTGVFGLASVTGVEETADIQTHDVEVALNGIPFHAAADLSASVRNRDAQIVAVWRNASGAQVGPARTIFKGKADTLTVDHTGDNLIAKLTLRSAAFDFRLTGQSYYSDNEQGELYVDDTGFSFMSQLTNKNSAGWSLSGSSGGGGGGGSGKVYVTATGSGSTFAIRDTAGRLIRTNSGTKFRKESVGVFFPGNFTFTSGTTKVLCKWLNLALVPTVVNSTAFVGTKKVTVKVTKGTWRPIIVDGAGFLRAGSNTGEKLIVGSDLRVYGESSGKRPMMVMSQTRIVANTTISRRVNTTKFAKAIPL